MHPMTGVELEISRYLLSQAWVWQDLLIMENLESNCKSDNNGRRQVGERLAIWQTHPSNAHYFAGKIFPFYFFFKEEKKRAIDANRVKGKRRVILLSLFHHYVSPCPYVSLSSLTYNLPPPFSPPDLVTIIPWLSLAVFFQRVHFLQLCVLFSEFQMQLCLRSSSGGAGEFALHCGDCFA